jgi:hypothetical protein
MYHCEFSEQDKEIIKHAVIYDESPMIRKRMAALIITLAKTEC